MKMNKIALLLAALLCTSCIAGCTTTSNPDAEKQKPKNDEAPVTDETPVTDPGVQDVPEEDTATETAPSYGLYDYTWNFADDEVMLTINGEPVTFDMYRHFLMYNKSYFDGGDPSFWTEENTRSSYNEINEVLKSYYVNMILAKEKGLELTEEDYTYIDEELDDMYSQYEMYGLSFEDQLSSMFLNRKVYRDLIAYDFCAQNLIEALVDPAEADKYINENYVTVQHVLVSTMDEAGQPLPEDQAKEKEALANEIYNKALAGEDFRTLIDTYGEDPGMEAQDAYTFTYDEMVAEFEAKSFEIAEGEISEPVKTDYGYHIIKKLPLDKSVFEDKNAQPWLTVADALGYEKYSEEVTKAMETLTVVETEAFKGLTMDNIGTLIPREEITEETVTEEATETVEVTEEAAETVEVTEETVAE